MKKLVSYLKNLYKFKKKLSYLVNLPLDITALSEKEERDINFIGKLNNNYIVLKMLYIKLKRVEDLNTKK